MDLEIDRVLELEAVAIGPRRRHLYCPEERVQHLSKAALEESITSTRFEDDNFGCGETNKLEPQAEQPSTDTQHCWILSTLLSSKPSLAGNHW